MANKAVLGVAAVGVGAYYLNESLKDRLVQREEEERRQKIEDLHEERLRRECEQKTKKSGRNVRDCGSDNDNDVMKIYHEKVEVILLESIRAVEETAKEVMTKKGAGANRHLPLPLLSIRTSNNQYNSNEEILLGAALALADYDVIQATMSNIPSICPGLGLANLSCVSIRLIHGTFMKRWEAADSDHPFDDYDKIRPLIALGAFSEKAQNGPVLYPITTPTKNLRSFLELAHSIGLYVIPTRSFSKIQTGKPGMRNMRLKFELTSGNKQVHPGEEAFVSNFSSSFSVPVTLDESGQSFSYNFSSITVLTGSSRRNKGAKTTQPNQGKAIDVLASFVASKIVKIAAGRLNELLICRLRHNDEGIGSSGGISLAHIATACGAHCEILQHLVESDIALIEGNRSKIVDVITSKLEECVPCPENDFSDGDELSPDEKLATGKALREMEISVFVKHYVQLLNLAYCEIPRLGGLYPSQTVNKITVLSEAEEGILDRPPLTVYRIRRLLEQNERRRINKIREIVAPSIIYTYAFLVVLSTLTIWLSYKSMGLVISRFLVDLHPICHFLPMGLSIVLGFWCVQTTLQMMKYPLRLPVDTNDENGGFKEIRKISSLTVEAIDRRIALFLGRPLPFDREFQRVIICCQNQHREWINRIARREYYNALHRKRITYDDCMLLIQNFTESKDFTTEENYKGFQDSTMGEYEECIFPGSVQEGEAFVQLEIDENDDEEYEKTPLKSLMYLSVEIEEHFQFSAGDVVLVTSEEVNPFEFESQILMQQAGEVTALSCRTEEKGTVAWTFPGHCVVIFGGESSAVVQVVRTSQCHLLAKTADRYKGKDKENITQTAAQNAKSKPKPVQRKSVQKRKNLMKVAPKNEREAARVRIYENDESNVDEPAYEPAYEEEKDGVANTKRSRTVEEALEEGGWERIVGTKNHLRFRRYIKGKNGGDKMKQSFTMPKTPSDRRATKNSLSTLNRLNRDVALHPRASGRGCISCSICGGTKFSDNYSKKQLTKPNPKCKECVASM